MEAHDSKCNHLGIGREPVPKTTFATANQNRDYRIFEELAFYMMGQARSKRVKDIFKLKGKVYAFIFSALESCDIFSNVRVLMEAMILAHDDHI